MLLSQKQGISSKLTIDDRKEAMLLGLVAAQLSERLAEIPTEELMTIVSVLESFSYPETRKVSEKMIRNDMAEQTGAELGETL